MIGPRRRAHSDIAQRIRAEILDDGRAGNEVPGMQMSVNLTLSSLMLPIGSDFDDEKSRLPCYNILSNVRGG